MVKYKCKQCRNYFNNYRKLKNKFCSRKCYSISLIKETLQKHCLYCGNRFSRKRWNDGVLESNLHFSKRICCCRSHAVKYRWKNKDYRKKSILSISKSLIVQWKAGKRVSGRKGGHVSILIRKKMSITHKNNRQKNKFWKGGITSLHKFIRESLEYRIWRESVFKRDDYTCQECFIKGGKLHAHHKNKTFSELLKEFLQEYSQFSPIEDKETLIRLAITYQPFWDISNGITFCKKCHQEIGAYNKQWSKTEKLT